MGKPSVFTRLKFPNHRKSSQVISKQQPGAVGKKTCGKTGSTTKKPLSERLGKSRSRVIQAVTDAVSAYRKKYEIGFKQTHEFLRKNSMNLDAFKPSYVSNKYGNKAEKYVVDCVACPKCGKNLHYAPAGIPGIDVMCSCGFTCEVKYIRESRDSNSKDIYDAKFNPKLLLLVLDNNGSFKTTSFILVRKLRETFVAFNYSIGQLHSQIQGRRHEIEQMIIENKSTQNKKKFSVEFDLSSLNQV